MKKLIGLLFLMFVEAGCAAVVRDPHVYRQQILWFGHAIQASTMGQLAQAAAHARGGDMAQCEALAENALVYRVTAPWQVQAALHLGDMADNPGPAPVVPTASAWCLERHLSANDPSSNPPAPPASPPPEPTP